jgi:hypothetical protein
MSLRPLRKVTLPLFSLIAAGSMAFAQDQKQKPAEPAKESPSATARPKQNGLKHLEDDLFKPLKTVAPGSSLDGVFVTPPPPAPIRPQDDRKLREKLAREKDWVFTDPQEKLRGPSDEEMFNLPGKDKERNDKKKLSPVEQYYLRAFHLDDQDKNSKQKADGKKKSNNPLDPMSSLGSGDDKDDDDSGLPVSLRETQRALKSLSSDERNNKEKPSWTTGNGFFSDIFGLSHSIPTPAELEARRQEKERMDDFKKMLGVPVVPAAMDSFNPLAGLGNPTPSTAVPAIGLPSVPSASKAPSMNVQLGTIGGLPAPMASPLSAPSIPSYLNPAPPLEQPKPHQMPPATTFAAPRRAF